MSRRTLGIPAGAGAVALLLLLGTGLGWWNGRSAERAPSSPISISTSVMPGSTFFGDPITAEVVVGLDPKSVSPSTLAVQPDFTPYVVTGPPIIRRSRSGSEETVSYTYSIQCETDGCLPANGPATIRFARVTATVESGSKRLKVASSWPDVVVSSRLEPSDLRASKPPFRHPPVAPPIVFGVDPGALADGLTAAAGLFGLAALALLALEVAAVLARRRGLVTPGRLEAAVALVREAAGREDPADRRKALELLAEALAVEGRPTLAGSAGDTAWAEPAPTPAQARELADKAESPNDESPNGKTESLTAVEAE